MAILVEALLGAHSRLDFLPKVREEKNLADPDPIPDGYVHASSVELCRSLVGKRAREAEHRNADCTVFRFERARRDARHRGRRLGAHDAQKVNFRKLFHSLDCGVVVHKSTRSYKTRIVRSFSDATSATRPLVTVSARQRVTSSATCYSSRWSLPSSATIT